METSASLLTCAVLGSLALFYCALTVLVLATFGCVMDAWRREREAARSEGVQACRKREEA